MDYAKRHNILFNKDRFADLVPVNAYENGSFSVRETKATWGHVGSARP